MAIGVEKAGLLVLQPDPVDELGRVGGPDRVGEGIFRGHYVSVSSPGLGLILIVGMGTSDWRDKGKNKTRQMG